jgi:type IV pilus biogenesis protein CpaD/CtpE
LSLYDGVNVISRLLLCALIVLGAAAHLSATPRETAPAYLGQHRTTTDDIRAIESLLETYTTSVTNADKAAFEALLLNEEVPFSSTDELVTPRAGAQSTDTRRYQRFRKAVFESGVRYTQHFYNVHIQQDGDLAQVSVDFITQETQSGRGGFGWKLLQLLKIDGRWKIASEIYTVRGLPSS